MILGVLFLDSADFMLFLLLKSHICATLPIKNLKNPLGSERMIVCQMKKGLFFIACLLFIVEACTFIETNQEDSHLYRVLIGSQYGFIDSKGKIVIEPQFNFANSHFSEGLCFVKTGGRTGFIDSTGTFVLELADSINFADDFCHGLARVTIFKLFKNGLYTRRGVINKKGEFIIEVKYHNAFVNQDGDSTYIVVEKTRSSSSKDLKNNWFITNRNGKIIGDLCDSIFYGFSDGLCAIKKSGSKWGYIDSQGYLIIDTIYDSVKSFSENGIARVKKGAEYSYINKKGEILFSADSTLTGMSCNRAAVIVHGKKHLVNIKGEIICPLDADDIYDFHEEDSLATIIKDGKALKIDTMGNVVLKTNYDYIGMFADGIAPAYKYNKKGYIDREGNEVINVSHDGMIADFNTIEYKVRAVSDSICSSYYNIKGELLWKDLPTRKKWLPLKPERNDFIDYFDDRIASLDPIEGIYYVTDHHYYQSRTNPSVTGSNGTKSYFYAVVKDDKINGFRAYSIADPGYHWVNKFVKIGDSNNYAIMKIDKDNKFSSEGKVTLEDPFKFEFQLEQEHNKSYNFYIRYEFVKDYPLSSDYEMVQKPDWTGTGFAIYDGYIATNYHVTNGAKTIKVKGIGGDMKKSYKGFVVAKDKAHDIAIVRIVDKDFDSFGSIPYGIGKTNVEVGDNVFVLGFPMTDTMGEEIKLTEGVINAASGYKGDESMYQISASVQPGNSGGPLINEEGTVIGIVCGKHTDAENVNYAVKISYLFSLINNSKIGIDISRNDHKESSKLSTKVKKYKNLVYLIECSKR